MRFLINDSHTGKLSASKLWMNIAYAVATYVVIKTADNSDAWQILLVYLAVVGSSEIAKKLIMIKTGGIIPDKEK
jgi:hypothetical protein